MYSIPLYKFNSSNEIIWLVQSSPRNMSQIFVSTSRKYPDETEIEELLERKKAKIQRKVQCPPSNVSNIFQRRAGGRRILRTFKSLNLMELLRLSMQVPKRHVHVQFVNEQWNKTLISLLIGRYENVFTLKNHISLGRCPRGNMISSSEQIVISPY